MTLILSKSTIPVRITTRDGLHRELGVHSTFRYSQLEQLVYVTLGVSDDVFRHLRTMIVCHGQCESEECQRIQRMWPGHCNYHPLPTVCRNDETLGSLTALQSPYGYIALAVDASLTKAVSRHVDRCMSIAARWTLEHRDDQLFSVLRYILRSMLFSQTVFCDPVDRVMSLFGAAPHGGELLHAIGFNKSGTLLELHPHLFQREVGRSLYAFLSLLFEHASVQGIDRAAVRTPSVSEPALLPRRRSSAPQWMDTPGSPASSTITEPHEEQQSAFVAFEAQLAALRASQEGIDAMVYPFTEQDDDYDRLLQLDDNVAPQGLPTNRIASYPITTVHSKEGSCAVCMDDWAEGDQVMTLSCGHQYHEKCITMWLCRSTKCPLDNRDLSTEQ